MTGFGEARLQDDRLSVSVELRTVNNRHLKLSAKISEPYGSLEPDLERMVREVVKRGTVQLVIRIDRPKCAEDYKINTVALASYRAQVAAAIGDGGAIDLSALLLLPGVVESKQTTADLPRDDWPVISGVVETALARLQEARDEEGRAMAAELLVLGRSVAQELEKVAERVPEVVTSYRDRLTERVRALVADKRVSVEPKDLIREVAILAERSDIAEEITRLRAHLAQYVDVIHEPESAGRKLEFVVQEMGRETNTIGSKGSDVEISRSVVEIKGVLEKIRELIQNIE
jgi:uncharacterized protein (TIGR00255 family)